MMNDELVDVSYTFVNQFIIHHSSFIIQYANIPGF